MNIRIVFLKQHGDYKPGQIVSFDVDNARRFVANGDACYYADFKESMLPEVFKKPAEVAPEGEPGEPAADDASGKGRKGKGKGKAGAEVAPEGEPGEPAADAETEAQNEGE